ncbi:uncharacterized protein LOC134177164 isoform X2 [Corticium candelabrum]|uniref:uncharacterized protein LOC134177164 isoform X2 n=1 Tax=Corticium candelabrum TaxID=121492 RepID=UPI002E26167E|nr:uncharacterized protein LOC134177164 isoform X2 [Corticium candelabrum]
MSFIVTTLFVLCISHSALIGISSGVTLESSSAENGVAYMLVGQGATRMVCNTSKVSSSSQVVPKFYHGSTLLDATTLDHENMRITNKNILHIRSIEGNYSCCINVQQVDHCSNSIRVIVFDVPVITLLTTRKMTVAVGSNVTISATVSGNNVRWLAMWEFGVNPLWESAEQLDFTQKRQWTVKLSINSLSYTDQGTYRLAVSNKYATRKMSPQVELTIQEPPGIPSNLTVKAISTQSDTDCRLFLRWTTVRQADDYTHNRPPDKFIVSYQIMGDPKQEWKERVVKDVKEATLVGLPPCTTFNIMVIACNTVACSLSSQSVRYTTKPSHSSTWLEDRLAIDEDSSTLLFRNGHNTRQLCVPRFYTPNITSHLCTQLSSTRVTHSGVITLEFQCQQKSDDLTQCAFKCPKVAKVCGQNETIVYLQDICGHDDHHSDLKPTQDVLSPTQTRKPDTHNISTIVLILAMVCSILVTIIIMAGIFFYYLHRKQNNQYMTGSSS